MSKLRARFGPAVRHLRLKAGLSQAELGDRVGKSQPWVAAIESGRLGTSLGAVDNLAEALGVSAEELLGLDPTTSPSAA